MTYWAQVKVRGKGHPVQRWGKKRNVKPGYRYPATRQLRARPKAGAKIAWKYFNDRMSDLLNLNGWIGLWHIRRVGAFLFNRRNRSMANIFNRIPYPIPDKVDKKGRHKPRFAIAEGIVCDGDKVPVVEERGKWCRLATPFVATLYEVEIGTGKMHRAGLRWYIYPDDRSGQVWIEKSALERI